MNAQHIFYILGSIAFGLVALITLVFIIVILLIKRQVTRLVTHVHRVSGEISDLVETGKRYTETLGNSFVASVALKLLKSFMRRRK